MNAREQRIVNTYRREVFQRGKRGALARAAKTHGISDERVRQLVKKADDERAKKELEAQANQQNYVELEALICQTPPLAIWQTEREVVGGSAWLPADLLTSHKTVARVALATMPLPVALPVVAGLHDIRLTLLLLPACLWYFCRLVTLYSTCRSVYRV